MLVYIKVYSISIGQAPVRQLKSNRARAGGQRRGGVHRAQARGVVHDHPERPADAAAEGGRHGGRCVGRRIDAGNRLHTRNQHLGNHRGFQWTFSVIC